MKTRSFISFVAVLLMSVWGVSAQEIQEKVPTALNGIWQMCFYSSPSSDVPGELRTGNSLKVLSGDGRFTNLVMMQQGAIVIGYGTYVIDSDSTYTEYVEKNIHLPQLDTMPNKMHFELEENNNLMFVKYFLTSDRNGNQIDAWCHEIWKRVDMPTKYPENIIR